MSNPTVVKRVVGCFGSSQLITALTVLRCREQEQQHLNYEYKNYLVIYDLLSPKGQIDDFAALVQEMAELACSWEAIVYLKPEQLETLKYKLNFSKPAEIFSCIHQLIGTEQADEIYLCRNWTTGDELLTNSYLEAERICYGDGLGVYLPESYFLNRLAAYVPQEEQSRWNILLKQWFKNSKESLKAALGLKTILKTIPFNRGYFFLPNALGEGPSMPATTIPPEIALEVMQRFKNLLEPALVVRLQALTANRPVMILLTANHAEQERTTVENEILAYKAFLQTQNPAPGTVLLIKPHPRDAGAKIQQLKAELSDLFEDIYILTEASLFFIPFEIFLINTFVNRELAVDSNVKIITFSSACLSLELFFKAKPVVGFGSAIVQQYFYEHCVSSRVQHEADLLSALAKIQLVKQADAVLSST